jgi:hypothetical protein
MISFFSYAAADTFRLARSKVIVSPDDDVYGLIHMPRYAFLLNAWVKLITPYSAISTGAITIGIAGNGVAADPDAILLDVDIDSEAAGWTTMLNGTGLASEGYWFDVGSGAVTATFSIGDSSANCSLIAFAQYTILT